MVLDQSQLTTLLQRWSSGDSDALDQLVPVMYDRLRDLAHHRLTSAPGERSLNTTGLVHEAYLRLVDSPAASIESRQHFLALASRVMRNVLVDHARTRRAEKRGGGLATVELHEEMWINTVDVDAVADLDEALKRLERLDARQCQVVELRYFGGLTEREAAEVLGISVATLKRDWDFARAWLSTRLTRKRL